MSRKSFYKQSAKVNATSITTLLEVEKPTKFTKSGEDKKTVLPQAAQWKRWFFYSGILVLLLFLLTSSYIGMWYWKSFEKTSGVSVRPIVQQIWNERNLTPFSHKDSVSFLLLGVDQSANQREASQLTDTMIMASLHQTGAVTLVSFPRDLWVDSLKTRINALYYYGQQTNPGDGITLVSSVLNEITGVTIDHYLIINMDSLKQLVDAVGGVSVPVARSFTDTQYPREVDLSSKDPAVLYETIQFDAGLQTMDGKRALQFIRSRHSADPYEGTDEGREERQQLLISSLKKQLLNPQLYANPATVGALYRVWKNEIKTDVSDAQIVALLRSISGKQFAITSAVIPIEQASESGILYHPKVGPANQWVFLPKDATWNELKQWFKEKF